MGYSHVVRSPLGPTFESSDQSGPFGSRAVDFGSLVRAVATTSTGDDASALEAARRELWRTVFTMPGWLLIATDLDGVIRPHVRHDGDRGQVLAFTDEFAALRYQAEHGLTFRAGFATLQVAIDIALDVLAELAAGGATELRFNDGGESFGAPINMLRRIRRCVGAIPESQERSDSAPDRTIAGDEGEGEGDDAALSSTIVEVSGTSHLIGPLLTHAARDRSVLPQALDALFTLPDWWFLCNPKQPDAFHVRRFAIPENGGKVQRQAVVAFTAHRLALEATEAYKLTDSDGSIVLMQMPVRDVVQWVQSFLDHDVDTVMLDPLTTPLALRIESLPEEWSVRNPEQAPDSDSTTNS